MTTNWVIYVSEDGCETMLTGVDNLSCNPQLLTCTEGKPMTQVMQFEADDYDAALVVKEQWMADHRWDWAQAYSKGQRLAL